MKNTKIKLTAILISLALLVILGSFVFGAYSTDRTEYYYDQTYYITDLIESSSPKSLNNSGIENGMKITAGGWAHTVGTDETYTNVKDITGAGLSMDFSGMADSSRYEYDPPDNASFTGKVGMTINDVNDGNTYCCFNVYSGGDYDEKRLCAYDGTEWRYAAGSGPCDVQILRVSDKNITLIFNFTDGGVSSFIDGKICHNKTDTGFEKLDFWCGYNSRFAGYWHVADIWVSNNDRPEEVIPPLINKTEVVLKDDDLNILNPDLTISQDKLLYIMANYTTNDVVNVGSECNFTAVNISTHISRILTTNYSLVDSSSQLEHIVNETGLNATDDLIQFSLCRKLVKASAQIYINGSLFHTVSEKVIPLCTLGEHTEVNLTTDYLDKDSLNITIKCDDCDGANTQLTILTDDDSDEILHWERAFTTHFEELTYNAGSTLYEFTEHLYHYKFAGAIGNITAACNETSSGLNFNISSVAPTVSIISINDVDFVDGMNVESNLTTSIITEANNDIIIEYVFNVTYGNGTLINTTDTEDMELSDKQLNKDGFYNISLSAENLAGNISGIRGYFMVNDTIPPVIVFNFPLSDNTTKVFTNETFELNVTITDINLFAYEILTIDPYNNTKFNFSQTGLNVTSYTVFEEVVPDTNGIWEINATVSDSHTGVSISDYDYYITPDDKIEFYFTEIKDHIRNDYNITIAYTGHYNIINISLNKTIDRYTFDYDFSDSMEIIGKNVIHNFRITCSKIYVVHNTKYKGHLVCYSAEKWIDFESPDVIDYYFKTCGEDCYDLTLITKPVSKLHFNSIGGLNFNYLQATFLVEPAKLVYDINNLPTYFFNNDLFDASTTAGVLLLCFFFLILVALVIFSEFSQIPAIAFFTGIFAFFFSMLIYVSISAILGLVLVVLGLFYIVRASVFVFGKK